MGKESAFSYQKGAFAGGRGTVSALKDAVISRRTLFLAEGRLRWQEGRHICLGVVMGEKGQFLCQSSEAMVSLVEWAPYPLRRAQPCAEKAPFHAGGRICWREGNRIYLEGAVIGGKAPFCASSALSVVEGAPYQPKMAQLCA